MSKFCVVEKQFEYKGHDCVCVFTALGARNGYVSVDGNKEFDKYDIDCHCCLSFGVERLSKECTPKKDYYVGFDCAHICDGRDWDMALKYGLITEKRYNELMEMEILLPTFLQPVRSLEYVEDQCKKIVDQLEADK